MICYSYTCLTTKTYKHFTAVIILELAPTLIHYLIYKDRMSVYMDIFL